MASPRHTVRGTALGVAVAFSSNRKDLLRLMVGHLPGFSPRPRTSPRHRFELHETEGRCSLVVDGERSVGPVGRGAALDRFRSEAQLRVAASCSRFVFVHAGAVVWQGRAIVLPGPSRSGKTTLVRALLARGARCLSDEYALFDGRGRVHPYPRPLQIRVAGRTVRRTARALGASSAHGAYPVGAVILAQYRKGARWEPVTATRGRGVLRLFANTVSARSQPSPALRRLSRALRGACVVLEGERGEAAQAAAAILAALEPAASGAA